MIYIIVRFLLILGWSISTYSINGFYLIAKWGSYGYRDSTTQTSDNNIYGAFSNINYSLQQEATKQLLRGKGIQLGGGYTFAKRYKLEVVYLTYHKTFHKNFDWDIPKELLNSGFSDSDSPYSVYDTENKDALFPKQKYTLTHFTYGPMLMVQCNLLQPHPRIAFYTGIGIGLLGRLNEEKYEGKISEIPEPPLGWWSLLCMAKYGLQCRITEQLIIDFSHLLTLKKYHLFNIDSEGNRYLPSERDSATLSFIKIGAIYHLK
jgi:hypothetical protein